MHVSDLSPKQIERINQYRYDRIIEKHEGPERWASVRPICEQVPGEGFFLATVYHEWFIVENP